MMKTATFALAVTLAMTGCSQENGVDNPAIIQADAQTTTATRTAAQAQPVVVELYQSQGCSSCPPAIKNINAIAGDPGILALEFAVTYWDRLGWKDTFGDKKYTARQWDYANAAGRSKVYTPQVVINGKSAIVGSRPAQISSEIKKAGHLSGPAITASNGSVKIASAKGAKPANVWLVRYDPRVQNVSIKNGENAGRTLAHKNIVREIVSLGQYSGQSASFKLPANGNANYKSAVLVQNGKGGPIVAARKL